MGLANCSVTHSLSCDNNMMRLPGKTKREMSLTCFLSHQVTDEMRLQCYSLSVCHKMDGMR